MPSYLADPSACNREGNDYQQLKQQLLEDVLSEVLHMLSDMKPEVIAEVTDRVIRQTEGQYESRIHSLEGEVQELKKDMGKALRRLSNLQTADKYEARIRQMEKQVQELKKAMDKGPEPEDAAFMPSQRVGKSKPNEFPGLDNIKVRVGLHYGGWIFYQNPLMADHLYMVREDGTENTQLSDCPVLLPEVKHGYLCFRDYDYKDHKIKIPE